MSRLAGVSAALLGAVVVAACDQPIGPDVDRLTIRIDNAFEVIKARVLAPGGVGELRRTALPIGGEPPGVDWSPLLSGLVQGARVEAPVFAYLADPEGSDLVRLNQTAYVEEIYLIRAVQPGARTLTAVAELRLSPVPAEVARLPER